MKQKIQLAVFGVMLLVLVAVILNNLSGPAKSAPQVAVAASGQDAIQIGLVTIPDAELHVELLDVSKRPKARPPRRNIFAYGAAPAASQPVVEVVDTAAEEKTVEETSSAPSAPKSPFRYFGVVEEIAKGNQYAFLTDGTNIFSAVEGKMILKRYRIVKIHEDSLELEDTREGRSWVLNLEVEKRGVKK